MVKSCLICSKINNLFTIYHRLPNYGSTTKTPIASICLPYFLVLYRVVFNANILSCTHGSCQSFRGYGEEGMGSLSQHGQFKCHRDRERRSYTEKSYYMRGINIYSFILFVSLPLYLVGILIFFFTLCLFSVTSAQGMSLNIINQCSRLVGVSLDTNASAFRDFIGNHKTSELLRDYPDEWDDQQKIDYICINSRNQGRHENHV